MKTMNTVCDKNRCTGCMACVEACPCEAISIRDDIVSFNAIKNADKCIDCGLCEKVCHNIHSIDLNPPIFWYQGWAEDDSVRAAGSSGGIAGAISRGFVGNGGLVCSCLFKDGKFLFDLTESPEDLYKFAGSKYVKSDPSGIYSKIKALLPSRKVLFIGLPCQVAGLKTYLGRKNLENLYTIDLICHGTPSANVLELFLKQHNRSLNDIQTIKFRRNGRYQVMDGTTGITTTGICDSYMLAYLNGVCNTENCYSCHYAQLERTSDITLGDSWGSDLENHEMQKGLSLVLCQTEKGEQLLNMADIKLLSVDVEKAIHNNQQLIHPMSMPEERNSFLEAIRSGKSFDYEVLKRFPKQYIRQLIKRLCIWLHILKVK